MLFAIRETAKRLKNILKENSFQNLLCLIDLCPALGGFSYFSGKVKDFSSMILTMFLFGDETLQNFLVAPFWIFLLLSTIYVNIIGTVIYQMYYADGFIDTLNSYFNISIFIIIYNNSRWLLFERKGLSEVLELAKLNDEMVTQSKRSLGKHQQLLKSIKNLVILCYLFHFINEVIIYTPQRLSDIDEFSVVSCVGMEPVTVSPNKEICMALLATQEIFAIIATAGYDATFLFLFAHTAAMFDVLYEETLALDDFNEVATQLDSTKTPEERLKSLIHRHSLILHTVEKIQEIYSFTIGVSFGLEAITICLFFVLPLDVCLNFAPVIFHGLFFFFLYCYQGQKMTTAAERFEMAVYCSGWQNFNIKEQKMILFMLKKSQRPVILLAASVIPIRLYTFAYIMQSIYKFVTVFKT